MADYGTTRRIMRDKVPVQVLTGYFPTEPVKLSSLAYCQYASTSALVIKSGMAIVKSLLTGAGAAAKLTATGDNITVPAWRPAVAADAAGGATSGAKQIYIALHDQDAMDVQAAGGLLVGLDCSDKFEIQTGYFSNLASPVNFTVGTAITIGIDTATSNGGYFRPASAASSDLIVGRISAVGTGTNLVIASGSGLTPSIAAANTNVIQFTTQFTGVTATANNLN